MPVDEKIVRYIKLSNLNPIYQQVGPSPTLGRSAWVKKLINEGRQIVNSTAGQPDLLAPEEIREVGAKAIMDGNTSYTQSGGDPKIRENIADIINSRRGTDYKWNNIFISDGLKEGLNIALHVLLNPERKHDRHSEVIIPRYFWGTYKDMVFIHGGKPVIADDAKPLSIIDQISPFTQAIILNYPNNPSGDVIPKKDLISIAESCALNHIFLILDIVYKDITRPNVKVTLPYELEKEVPGISKYLIEGDGLSKGYGKLTGIRTGMIIAPETLVEIMTTVKDSFSSNTNYPGQLMLLEAIKMDPERQLFELN